jgi:hypothetical protein
MKKSLIFTFAAAFLALTACQKEASQTPAAQKTIRFQATDIETRTVFGTPDGSTYPTLWTDAGIQAGISLNLSSSDKVAADVTPSADGKTATFKAVFESPATASSYTFVAFYPNSVVKSVNATNKTLNIEFPAGQTSTATTPDENAQIIYAVSETFTELPNTDIPLSFKHASAYLHLAFTNAALNGATVSAVNVTSSTPIVGRWFFNLADATIAENATGKTVSIATESLENVWCALAPTDLSGATLKFVISTDRGTLTKEITLPADRKLTPGSIKKLTVDLAGIPIQAPVVYKLVTSKDELYFGDKVIVVSAGELEKALGSTQNDKNRSAADIAKEENYIYNPSDAVQQLILEEGAIPGMYSFKTTAGYLYAPGGGNYLRTQAAKDAAATFDITIDEAGTKIIGQKPGITQVEMRYNNNTNPDSSVNNLFSCYASTSSCKPVVLYRMDIDPMDEEQYFTASLQGNTSLSAGAHTVQVYVFGNVAWTASTTGGTLDSASGNTSKILTLSIPENTGSSAITYTVTVSTTASVSPKSYEFTLTQAAPVSGGLPVGTVLWSESFAGGTANATPSAYQSSGTGTTVYGEGSVTYTQNSSSTKLYTDGLVYLPKDTSPIPDGCNPYNLLVSKSGGYWKISGIPCQGVAKAKLVYYSNSIPTAQRTVTTDTQGVTLSSYSNEPYKSEWNKDVNVISYEISFDDSFTGETFNLQFNNTNTSSNIRVTDAMVVVTE